MPPRFLSQIAGLIVLASLCTSCARGTGGPPVGPSPIVSDPPPPTPSQPGLIGVTASDRGVRIDWRDPAVGFEVLLFRSTDRAKLFDGTPVRTVVGMKQLIVQGLENGVDHFFGMAIRPQPPTNNNQFTRVGVVLRARPNPPIFVDAAATAPGDGRSPGGAFPSLGDALASGTTGGRNIWIRDGQYEGIGLRLLSGDQCFGGFPGDFGSPFDLQSRDPSTGNTVFLGRPGTGLLTAASTTAPIVLDGMVLDGQQMTFNGIDANNASLEARSVTMRNFAGRGMRLRNTLRSTSFEVHIANCAFNGNGNEGLSVDGAYDIRIYGSRFVGNQEEGLDLAALIALEGENASLDVTASVFHGNGAEGMDADLAAPPAPTTPSGRFTVSIRASIFSSNRLAGLLIDEDYELAPLWSAKIVVRECIMRANSGPGVHVDHDGIASLLLHRVRSTANGGDGVLITSELEPGFAQLSSSVFAGNIGAGARAAVGQKAIIASHCLFTGNAQGGLVSDVVESGATSSITRLQSTPFRGARVVASVNVSSPDTELFRNAPRGYVPVTAATGETMTIATPTTISLEDLVELTNDGIARGVASIGGTTITLDSVPRYLGLPASLAWFAPGAGVGVDYRLVKDSAASGKGMGLPGKTPPDAGVFGSPEARPAGDPDAEAKPIFWLTQTLPAIQTRIASGQQLVLAFSDVIDTNSPVDQLRAVTTSGKVLSTTFTAIGDVIFLFPPSTGWGTEPFVVEIHAGIRALSGTPLTSPIAIPLHPG